MSKTGLASPIPWRSRCAALAACVALASGPQVAAQQRYAFDGPALPAPPSSGGGGNAWAGSLAPPQSPQAHPDGQLVVDVRVEGNRTIDDAQVLGQLRTRSGRPFDEETVLQDVKKLHKLGWFAYVQPFYEPSPQGRIIVFKVVERPTVRYIEFLGNSALKDKKLAETVGIKEGDTLDPYRVQEGVRKIEEIYRSKGFNRVQVYVLDGLKSQDIGVAYVIHEGPKQKIQWVQFVGNDSGFVSDWRLNVLIQSKQSKLWLFKGEIDGQKLDADKQRIEEYYRGFGYFQARVQRELDFNEDGTWATLRFIIHEGPRFRVKNVRIEGNEQFATQDLLTRLQLKPGDAFEKSKLETDRTWLADLYGSQGHIYADIKANIVYASEPGELDLEYNIAEGERWRVGRIFVHIGGDNPHTKTTVALNHLTFAPGNIVNTMEIKSSERRLIASNLFHRDPSRGVAPRIRFQIPELEGSGPGVQARDAAGNTYRGQSPDSRGPTSAPPQRHATYRPPTADEVGQAEMHLDFVDGQHYQQWWQGGPPEEAPRGPQAAVGPDPFAAANAAADVAIQRSTPQRPVQEAYRHLLAPAAADAAAAQQFAAPPMGDPSSYRDLSSDNAAPALIYRGQNDGWGEPVRFGGLGMGSTGPADGGGNAAASPRVAQGSPLFDPNRPLSPSAPGTLPTPITPGEVYGLQPVDPFGPPFGDRMVDIIVDAEETQTGRFMAGVGINSDAGVVGSIVIDERNFDWRRWPGSWADIGNAFRGGGQQFRMEAAPGSQLQRYLISWSDPYWRGTPFSLGLAASYFDRRYRHWDEQRLGGRVSFGYEWPRRDVTATIAYRGENVNIHNPFVPAPPELAEVVGDNVLHGFRLSIANDTRDSAFLATTGHYAEISFEQVIGSFDYPRAVLDMRKYFLMRQRPDRSGRHVLSYSTRLGFTGSNTPIYEHFFAGGYSTLRGFDFRGASPVNMGVEVGGEFMWINTLEYLLPVTADDMFHMVGFVDFGTVEPRVEINDFRIAPGIGLRITVPAMGPAPIALDFAWPIKRADTDDREVFSFHVGLQRL